VTPAAERFQRLVAAFTDRDGVTVGAGRGFGTGTLQVDGRIFAMSNEAGLVLKLPAGRVAALLADGEGLPFDAGKGRPMKEWVVVPWAGDADLISLADEALGFVGRRT
jgi:hypothetical protein